MDQKLRLLFSVMAKLQRTVLNSDHFQANKSVIFKLSPGTGTAAHGVMKRKRLSYPNITGTDNNGAKTVMGSLSP